MSSNLVSNSVSKFLLTRQPIPHEDNLNHTNYEELWTCSHYAFCVLLNFSAISSSTRKVMVRPFLFYIPSL